MDEKKAVDDGGPAFPAPDLGEQDFGQRGAYPGMSLRDYFAAAALQGMLARPNSAPQGHPKTREGYSAAAFEMANAMMEARQ